MKAIILTTQNFKNIYVKVAWPNNRKTNYNRKKSFLVTFTVSKIVKMGK